MIDIKILWGRAGGKCSKPECNEDLTRLLATGNYVVGEMAHVIGSKPTAARGTPEGGDDTYDNLILLCPTHHTDIDKSPEGTFPVELIHEWKKLHEDVISNAGKPIKYKTYDEVKIAIMRILISNHTIFQTYGPHSDTARSDPTSNAYLLWELKRIDRIIPNNRKILNIIDENIEFFNDVSKLQNLEKFRIHAESFESHVYYRKDTYQLFPSEFSEIFLS